MQKRKKRKTVDPYAGHKYVVVKSKTGRLSSGIYKRRVSVDGDIAFVHPREGACKADIIPSNHVFDTQEQANAFFTAESDVQWVVMLADDDDEMPEVFQAKVRSYVTKRYGDRWSREVEVISRLDGKPVPSRWGTRGFKTEREAYRHMHAKMADSLKDAEVKLKKAQARKEGLLRIQRRIKQLGIRRGLKVQ